MRWLHGITSSVDSGCVKAQGVRDEQVPNMLQSMGHKDSAMAEQLN